MINIENSLSEEEIKIGMDLILEELQSRNERGKNPIRGYEIVSLIGSTLNEQSARGRLKLFSRFKEEYSDKLKSIGYKFSPAE